MDPMHEWPPAAPALHCLQAFQGASKWGLEQLFEGKET